MSMRNLVFGDRGYLGRHLVAALRAAGQAVIVGASRPDGGERPDLASPRSLLGVDWCVDRVFMLAGITGTGASFAEHVNYLRGNELALLNILDHIRQSSHRPRVIFPSSRLVYRGSDDLLHEDAPLEAKTIYASNKIACEFHIRAYAQAFDIPFTIFRLCVPYGNTQGNQYSFGTTGNFVNQALSNGVIRLYGDGSVRRSFTHIDDVTRMMVAGASSANCVNGIFNIPGENKSLAEAADCIAQHMNARVEQVAWPPFDLRIESGSTAFDGTKLLARLATRLEHDFESWAAATACRTSV